MPKVSLEYVPGRERSFSWGRKDEEYMADFVLVSRRTLTKPEYAVFNYHFVLGADWKMCCRRLSIDRGMFFHYVYRIEKSLGRIFRELEPHPLFPLEEYFSGATREYQTVDPTPPALARIGPASAAHAFRPRMRQSA